MEKIHDIYDRIAKRCISLSTRCTVNLINGLYGTDYPVDSNVTYHWTENEDDELKRTLADTIVTINDVHSYHIEFQMTKDGDIILRMLEYGFHHAMKTSEIDTIYFPEPLVIYLYNKEKLPDEYSLRIKFGTINTRPLFRRNFRPNRSVRKKDPGDSVRRIIFIIQVQKRKHLTCRIKHSMSPAFSFISFFISLFISFLYFFLHFSKIFFIIS